MPQFEIAAYFPQLFWLAIWFGLLVWGISRFLSPRYISIFQMRQKVIDSQLANIHKIQAKVEELQHQNNTLLETAHKESTLIMQSMVQKIHKNHLKKREAFEKKLQTRSAVFEEKLDSIQQDLVKECEEQSRAITESMLVKLTGSKPNKTQLEKILQTEIEGKK